MKNFKIIYFLLINIWLFFFTCLCISGDFGGHGLKYYNSSIEEVPGVSACKVPTILKKFVSKETTSEAAILKLFWQPDRVYETSSRPTRNRRAGEKHAILHEVSKIHFLLSDYALHYLQCYHLEVWSMLDTN